MIYSSSMIWASFKLNDQYYYLIRQSIFFLISVIALYVTSRLDLELIKEKGNLIFLFFFSLLIIVLIPGIGIVRGGARSWIGFNFFSIQPAEFMKIGLIIILSKYLEKNHYEMKKISKLFFPIFIILITFGLIMLEPDFGTGIILVLTGIMMIFVCGIKKKWIFFFLFIGIAFLSYIIISAPYRLTRIYSYLDPWSDPLGSGFQTIQALYAISPAGLFGYGLFNSRQKYYYLPEPQTDFIFAIIIEELGLIGGAFILFLFFIIFYNGILIVLKEKDKFKMFLAFGITSTLFIQFFINIGVVIGLLPVTGVTLPFLSYGGSSLLLNMIMIGLLVNIASDLK